MDQKALFMSTIADGRDVEYLTNWWRYAWKIIIFSKVFIFPGNPWTALWFRHLFAQKKEAAEGLGANPTDRGRSGTKIHLHVDQEGTPLGVIVVGANVHDSRLVGLTIENNSDLISMFNICTDSYHLCLDKGYDYPRVHEEVYSYGFESHIRSRGGGKNWEARRSSSRSPLGRRAHIRLAERLSRYSNEILPLFIDLHCLCEIGLRNYRVQEDLCKAIVVPDIL